MVCWCSDRGPTSTEVMSASLVLASWIIADARNAWIHTVWNATGAPTAPSANRVLHCCRIPRETSVILAAQRACHATHEMPALNVRKLTC